MPFLRSFNLRLFVYTLAVIAALALFTSPIEQASAADSTEPSLVGQWKLTAALDFSEIASLDEREAKQFIGETVTITRKQLRFGKEVCPDPGFQAERVEPDLYVRQHYRASAARLGLPNPVTMVHLECTSAFVKNRNRLVIFWDGWFFEAVRTRR
jgi:hypothetical protein